MDAEYRALTDTCALVARPDRGAVLLTGEKPAQMLNGLISNDVIDLRGQGRYALLLNSKGRVMTDLRVFPSSIGLLLDVPRAGLENLLAAFKKYIPPLYARFEDLSELIGHVGIYGPEAASVAREALATELPPEQLGVSEIQVAGEPVLVIRDRLLGDGVELIGSKTEVGTLADEVLPAVEGAGGRRADAEALEIVRVEWGVPKYGIDISDANLAQETGLEADAISYDKGCYLGQEVVARIHYRGHVNRHLRSLAFDDALPSSGSTLFSNDRKVGEVTSAVVSPEFGPIGLGYVRREIEPGSVIRWVDGETEGGARVMNAEFRVMKSE